MPATAPRRRPEKHQFLFAGCFICSVLLFLGPLLHPDTSFYRWDTVIYLWPLLVEMNQQWTQGQIPIWTSNMGNGLHLLGNISLGVFNPLHIIHRVLPFIYGYKMYVLATYSLSALFAFGWFRKGLNVSPWAALAGALTLVFSGYGRAMFDTHNFMILPWIPLLFIGLHLCDRAPQAFNRGACVCGIAWTLMIISGDIQQTLLAGMFSFLYVFTLNNKASVLTSWLLSGVFAVLLTAPQWLPTAMISTESYRAGGLAYRDAVELSFHPVRLLEIWIPHLFGTHAAWLAPDLFGPQAIRKTPWSASHHLPLLSLFIILAVLPRKKSMATRWAFGLAIFALLFSFGSHLPGFQFWQNLPLIDGFRYPEKYLFWLPVAAGLITAAHFDLLHLYLKKSKLFLYGLTAALMAAVGVFFQVRQGITTDYIIQRATLYLLLNAAFILFIIPVARQRLTATAFLLLLIQLYIPWRIEKPLAPKAAVEELTPVARDIYTTGYQSEKLFYDDTATLIPLPPFWSRTQDVHQRRVIRSNSSMPYNAARWWGLRTSLGFSPLEYKPVKIFKDTHAQAVEGTEATPADKAEFIMRTGSVWIFTDAATWTEIQRHGVRGDELNRWRANRQTSVLIRASNTSELSAPGIELLRPQQGTIILQVKDDLDEQTIRISETASTGWQFHPPTPQGIVLGETDEGFLTVSGVVKGDIIHIRYTPPGWTTAWYIHLSGWLYGVGFLIVQRRKAIPDTCAQL